MYYQRMKRLKIPFYVSFSLCLDYDFNLLHCKKIKGGDYLLIQYSKDITLFLIFFTKKKKKIQKKVQNSLQIRGW